MTKRVALIGHPVTHSLSGVLQQAAFDSLGIDARYELVDKPLIDLAETVAALRDSDTLGANITVPYKERVVPMMDRLSEEAQATGAVDTVTREGTRLIGHNADVPGFRKALDALVGKQKLPKAAVVLGAGGGARAVVYALITAGFQHVIVFNRHLHRAEASGPPLRPERLAHGAARQAVARIGARGGAGPDQAPRQRELGRTRAGRDAHPGGAAAPRAVGHGPAVYAAPDAPDA